MFYELLTQTLKKQSESVGIQSVIKAAADISEWYRSSQKGQVCDFVWTRERCLAYAVSRMPATFYAIRAVLSHVLDENRFNRRLTSITDLCSGPGTMTLALADLLGNDVEEIHQYERQPEFVRLAENLYNVLDSYNFVVARRQWKTVNVLSCTDFTSADFVTVGYGLNEMSESEWMPLLAKAWAACTGVMILVDPGTPTDYRRFLKVRKFLLELDGVRLLGPCSHMMDCPKAADIDSWCHFSCRLARTSLHRHAKGGVAAFEDERFTWLAIARNDVLFRSDEQEQPHVGRVINHPSIQKNQVSCTVCGDDGTICDLTFKKRDGEIYKIAKKKEWGDLLSGY